MTEDSVRGIVTFLMNRVVYAPRAYEAVNPATLSFASEANLMSFWNSFQNDLDSKKQGYASDDLDDDFKRYADSYIKSKSQMLLVGEKLTDGSKVQTAMELSKKVWEAARDQYKAMLAMNDMIIKAEKS